MKRNYEKECQLRVDWIRRILADSGANGIIFGNSGGKDSALVGILCRKATEQVLGLIMPCGSKQNYGTDTDDARRLAEAFDIPTEVVDLTKTRNSLIDELNAVAPLPPLAMSNLNPRLRMSALYAIGQAKGYLVAGTGNKSENFMGYFTKWGDGAYDFNPIGDLTVTEIYEFLTMLQCPVEIIEKPPSAGLFDGQTDEAEMGVTYQAIDQYITSGDGDGEDLRRIKKANANTEHKRKPAKVYGAFEAL